VFPDPGLAFGLVSDSGRPWSLEAWQIDGLKGGQAPQATMQKVMRNQVVTELETPAEFKAWSVNDDLYDLFVEASRGSEAGSELSFLTYDARTGSSKSPLRNKRYKFSNSYAGACALRSYSSTRRETYVAAVPLAPYPPW
jgi:hypothetical protein